MPRRPSARSLARTALAWVAQAAAFFGVWLLLVAKVSPGELLVGVLAAALAATASQLVVAEHIAAFAPQARALPVLARAPWEILVDTAVVLGELARRLAGRPGRGALVAFDFPTSGDDPGEAARRAIATLVTTLSPNSVVVDVDRARGRVLVHLLAPRGVPAPLARLGARA